jgi:hypothetical protein
VEVNSLLTEQLAPWIMIFLFKLHRLGEQLSALDDLSAGTLCGLELQLMGDGRSEPRGRRNPGSHSRGAKSCAGRKVLCLCSLRADDSCKVLRPQELWLRPSFHGGFADLGACQLDEVNHLAGSPIVELAGRQAADDGITSSQNGSTVAERGQGLLRQRGCRSDGPRVGSVQLLMVVAEGADGERGCLAAAAIGLGVAAGRVWVDSDAHGDAPALKDEGRATFRSRGPACFNLYFYCRGLTITPGQVFWRLKLL